MNYVLDRLDFKEQIVKTITKKNTSKYKDDQTGCWREVTLPSSDTIKEVGDYKHRRSEEWHQLEPTQKIDLERLITRDILFIFDNF